MCLKTSSMVKQAVDNFALDSLRTIEDKRRGYEAMEAIFLDAEASGVLFSERPLRNCLRCQKKCPLWDIQEHELGRPRVAFAAPSARMCHR